MTVTVKSLVDGLHHRHGTVTITVAVDKLRR